MVVNICSVNLSVSFIYSWGREDDIARQEDGLWIVREVHLTDFLSVLVTGLL